MARSPRNARSPSTATASEVGELAQQLDRRGALAQHRVVLHLLNGARRQPAPIDRVGQGGNSPAAQGGEVFGGARSTGVRLRAGEGLHRQGSPG